jgi:hypothetical protein
VTTLATERSARSGATWPTAWQVEGAGLDLEVRAGPAAGELWAFPASLWEGPVSVRGTVAGEPIDAQGFAEQAGAHRPPFRALLRSDPPPAAAVAQEAPPPGDDGPLVPWTLIVGPETEEAP